MPIKADRDLTTDEAKKNHLLLIGLPDSNCRRTNVQGPFRSVSGFVRSWFETRPTLTREARIAAAESGQSRFSIVVMAGLEAYSTWKAAPALLSAPASEVVVLPNGGPVKSFAYKGVVKKNLAESKR